VTIASDALDILFAASSKISVAATYTPDGGAPMPCRVIVKMADESYDAGYGASLMMPSRLAEVRVSEIAVASEGDTITIDGAGYPISSASQPDPDRLLWRLELGDVL
jgi:hypothetical protein